MTAANRRKFLATAGAALAAPAFTRVAEAATPDHHHVNIEKFKFEPQVLRVRAGDTIEWHNHDIAPHTATSRDGSWDTGTLAKDERIIVVVGATGSFEYYCRFHPQMEGILKVVAGD